MQPDADRVTETRLKVKIQTCLFFTDTKSPIHCTVLVMDDWRGKGDENKPQKLPHSWLLTEMASLEH